MEQPVDWQPDPLAWQPRPKFRDRLWIHAALFAATPMTLYFGGFPDVIGMPLVLFVLLSVTAYLPFHREPGLTTLAPFVGAFMFAGACDWPA